MRAYHDEEWGRPVREDRVLFEFLILEGAQAGLSWATILKKREAYREAFAEFDPKKVARFTDARLERILENPGIVRNRLKVFGARTNARAFLRAQEECGSFAKLVWGFAPPDTWSAGCRAPRTMKDVPARTAESDAMSKALKKRGFTFVGSTICYAYMQAVGMVNDHLVGCDAREHFGRGSASGESNEGLNPRWRT